MTLTATIARVVPTKAGFSVAVDVARDNGQKASSFDVEGDTLAEIRRKVAAKLKKVGQREKLAMGSQGWVGQEVGRVDV